MKRAQQLLSRVIIALSMSFWLHGSALAGVAIFGGTVFTMDADEPRQGVTILIDGGRILAIGDDVDIPVDFEQVDANGTVVTPGLIDSYTQLGLIEIGAESSTVDALVTARDGQDGVKSSHELLGPAFNARYALNADTTLIPVNRIGGITRAVVAPLVGNSPFAGWGAAIKLTDSDILVKPELALFGTIGIDSTQFVGGSRGAVIQYIRFALERAQSLNAEPYQAVGESHSLIDLAALQEFLKSKAPLVLTVHRANEIREALCISRDFQIPLIIHGGSEAWKVADLLAAAKVPVIVDAMDNLPINYDQLGARSDNAALLTAAGVPVLFTTEVTYNARLLRQTAGNAVAEGMPYMSALAAITRVPAETFGFDSGVGTLTTGAPADIVIWNGDPLELTTWAERVMIDGEWIPMKSRQTRLLERYKVLDRDKPFAYH